MHNMRNYLSHMFDSVKRWLQSFSFRTGLVVLCCCLLFYVISFAQMLLPISVGTKGILWTIFFGLAKTFQYGGLTILGAEGIKRFKNYIKHMQTKKVENNLKQIYFAGGCFWGTEHFFKQVRGVVSTDVGYANGIIENPTYEQVCSDTTRFAETVHVVYNPNVLNLEFLIELYFKAIDPVSVNQQGHDKGSQYRTGIYFSDPADFPVIERVYAREQAQYESPLAVEKLPLENYFKAEDYHQDYLDKNPDGYCHLPQSLFEFARNANNL